MEIKVIRILDNFARIEGLVGPGRIHQALVEGVSAWEETHQ